MNVEQRIRNCEIYQKQIKRYDPEPFYVNFFLEEFLDEINYILDRLFEDADRDFGLFIVGKVSLEKFHKKAKEKKEEKALEFLDWYFSKIKQINENKYSKAIQKISKLRNESKKIPEIKLMIRAIDRYKNDTNQEIMINLGNKKSISKNVIDLEMRRQLPIFLEMINYKRNRENEPIVKEDQIVVSTFVNIEDCEKIEIVYATEVYLSVIRRLIEEVREKVKELTTIDYSSTFN